MRRIDLVSMGVAGALLVGGVACDPVPPRWESRPIQAGVETVRPVVSADGRSVVFASNTALVPQDTNGLRDVYVRDLESGATTLVSVNVTGTASSNWGASTPALSRDGTKVAFESVSTDLTSEPVSMFSTNVFVRDLIAGTTSLVTTSREGMGIGGFEAELSPDGTEVLFSSYRDGFGPIDTNGDEDLYVRDLVRGTTSLVSVNGAGTDSGNHLSGKGAFSPDGTKVLFHSSANDLGPVDTNAGAHPGTGYGYDDVYLRDLRAGTTSLVSVNAAGTDSGNGESAAAVMSPDGTKVAFHSDATDLVQGLTPPVTNVYVRDLTGGTAELASRAGSGSGGGNAQSRNPQFSPDGAKLVFASEASDLGPADSNAKLDVYVRDFRTRQNILVSVNAAGTSGGNQASWTGGTHAPSFSPDGSKVAFVTQASDLGPRDTAFCSFEPKPVPPPPPEPCPDVYVRDLTARTTSLVSGDGNDTLPETRSSWPVFSPVANDQLFYIRNESPPLVAPNPVLHQAIQIP